MINLKHRIGLEVKGSDVLSFLQKILTNNVYLAQTQGIVYALLLNKYGKFIADIFIIKNNNSFIIDVDITQVDTVLETLLKYKLREDVKFDKNNIFHVFCDLDSSIDVLQYDLIFKDPRNNNIGYRIYTTELYANTQDITIYHNKRFEIGLAEGVLDLSTDKSIPLEFKLDLFNCIDFEKGCYIGQELTSRTKFVSDLQKNLFSIKFLESIDNIDFDSSVFNCNQEEIGKLKSHNSQLGLALLKKNLITDTLYINNKKATIFNA